ATDCLRGLVRSAGQRLLAEDGPSPGERGDRLLRMQTARRRDHNSVEVLCKQLFERAANPRYALATDSNGLAGCFRGRIRYAEKIRNAVGCECAEPVESDPTHAGESDTWPGSWLVECNGGHQHLLTRTRQVP